MKTYRYFSLYEANIPRVLYNTFCNHTASEDQCDCACGASVLVKDRTVPVFSSLSNSFKTVASFKMFPVIKEEYALLGQTFPLTVINHSAWMMLQHFQHSRPLDDIPQIWSEMWGEQHLHNALQRLLNIGVLRPEGCTAIPVLQKATSTLSAWLHLTDHCNLRCAYCYLPHTQAEMSIETGRAAINATFRSAQIHQYQTVKFKYAGGEPLFCFDTLTKLHRYAQMVAKQHRIGLDGIVLSNGTLITPTIVDQLRALNLRLMISLDGIGEFQDCQRHDENKQGTFEVVAAAIDRMLSDGLIPEISVTVSGRNIDGLPELFQWILDRDLPFSLNFYRENAYSSTETDLHLENEKMISGLLAAYKVVESNFPKRRLLNALVDRGDLVASHSRTCSVGQNYLVFDSQGQVAKCQMDITNTITDVHDPDPLIRICESRRGIQNLPVEEKSECRDCQWQYWCTGGCPLLTYRTTGRYDLKSPNCIIYKALFPEVIRLEGLRLLHSFAT